MENTEGNGGVYVAMMWAGTIELVAFGAIYLAYYWWVA